MAEKVRFRPHPIPVVASIVVVALGIAGVLYRGHVLHRSDIEISEDVGYMIGIGFWPLVFAWFAFRLGRGSNRAANWTFCIVFVLGLLAGASAGVKRNSAQAHMREAAALQDEARHAILSGDSHRASLLNDRAIEKTREAAAVSTGSEAVMMKYAADAAKQVVDLTRAANEALSRFVADGGGECRGLDDVAAIDRRSALLKNAIEETQKAARYFADVKKRAPTDLAALGVSQEIIDGFLWGLAKDEAVDATVKGLALQASLLNIFQARFVILKEYFGRWNIQDGRVAFSAGCPDQVVARYDEYGRWIDHYGNEMDQLQTKIMPNK